MISTSESLDRRFSAALAEFAPVRGDVSRDDLRLSQLRLDSLALVRIVLEVLSGHDDQEIDLSVLADLDTVADLRTWLHRAAATTVVTR